MSSDGAAAEPPGFGVDRVRAIRARRRAMAALRRRVKSAGPGAEAGRAVCAFRAPAVARQVLVAGPARG